jgi:hypothetical protein
MSETSTILPSQFLDETNKTVSQDKFILSLTCIFTSEPVLGKILLKGMKKAKTASTANGMLLLVSLISSDTLILINIRINKNKIETAPT